MTSPLTSAGRSNFDSYTDLIEAATAAGFGCDNGIRLSGDEGAWDQLQMLYDGVDDLGTCVNDKGTHYIAVFTDEASLESFIDTEEWIGFESFLAPVAEGETFTGVAGENWVITNYVPDDSFLHAIGARLVQSKPRPAVTQE